MNKKILICSGGTGGHVIPAINFGNFLLEKGYDCHIILDERGKQYSEKFKGKIYIINSSHFSGNFIYRFRSLIKLFIGYFRSFKLILKLRPNKCVAFGSYATFSTLFAILFIKNFIKMNIYLHEQNSIIGKVNLFFLPYAEYIFVNFNLIKNLKKKYIKKKYHVGLPSSKLVKVNPLTLNKTKNKKIIFLYGGSQGSIPLINKFFSIFKNIDNKYLERIKIFIQCPKEFNKEAILTLSNLKIEFEINEFYYNIDRILSITDIAITRAGAGTINDLIQYTIPSIIVPLPHSIYNHQYYNAKYLSDMNGSILMIENDFNVKTNSKIFIDLLFDYQNLEIMKKTLKTIELPDANNLMLSRILYEK